MRRERGCTQDLESPYIFPQNWGEVRRCPKSVLLNNRDLIILLNMVYSFDKKVKYEDYENLPNSLLSALDFAREAMNYREEKEGVKNG